MPTTPRGNFQFSCSAAASANALVHAELRRIRHCGAKQQAQQFILQGADIIMPAAGPVGLGAVAAAKADGGCIVGVIDGIGNPDYSSIVPRRARRRPVLLSSRPLRTW